MKNKKKQIVVMILLVLSLVLVTVGVTYAFFRYAKEGSTENTLTTGTIEFLYTEVDKVGAGISIENAFPISDSKGKLLTGAGNIFNFKITSKVSGDMDIPYTVTAKTKDGSELDPKVVRLYLTDTTGEVEKELLLDNYSNLDSYNNNVEEKIIYKGLVPTGSTNYEKTFALRMWVASDADFSYGSLNGKTFTITVNVYSNAKVVTEEEIDMANTTEIETIVVNNPNIQATSATDTDEYDYIANVDNEIEDISLDIKTTSKDAKVEITKIEDTTAYSSSNIKKISTTKTYKLEEGNNLFNIKITSANGRNINEYILNVYRALSCAYDLGQTWTYSSDTDVVIPCNGLYKVELYGEKGSDSSYTYTDKSASNKSVTLNGANGSYVYGFNKFTTNDILNVNTSSYTGGSAVTKSINFAAKASGSTGKGGNGIGVSVNSNLAMVSGGGSGAAMGGVYATTANNDVQNWAVKASTDFLISSGSTKGSDSAYITTNYPRSSYAYYTGGGGGGYEGGGIVVDTTSFSYISSGKSYFNQEYFYSNQELTSTDSTISYGESSSDTAKVIITLVSLQN